MFRNCTFFPLIYGIIKSSETSENCMVRQHNTTKKIKIVGQMTLTKTKPHNTKVNPENISTMLSEIEARSRS